MREEKPFTAVDSAKSKKPSEVQPDRAAAQLTDEDLAKASGGDDFTITKNHDQSSP